MDDCMLPGVAFSVVVLTYQAPIEAFNAMMAEHVAWMAAHCREGTILVSGRQEPLPGEPVSGGVLVLRGIGEAVTALVADLPFVARGLATAEIIPFRSGMAAPAMVKLLG